MQLKNVTKGCEDREATNVSLFFIMPVLVLATTTATTNRMTTSLREKAAEDKSNHGAHQSPLH
jgi:hypothetical protein